MRRGLWLLGIVATFALTSGMALLPDPIESIEMDATLDDESSFSEEVENGIESGLVVDDEAGALPDDEVEPNGDIEGEGEEILGVQDSPTHGAEVYSEDLDTQEALAAVLGASAHVRGDFPDATALSRGTQRAAGNDRYATAVSISKRLFPNGNANSVFIASGTSFSDGLTLGALAAYVGGPMLLVTSSTIPSVVENEIKRLNPNTIYIAGGTGAVGTNVERRLAGLATQTVRLAGANRYSTARAVAEQFPNGSAATIATGLDFPDALVAASAMPKLGGGPVLLSPGFKYTDDLGSALAKLSPSSVLIVGGTWSKADLSAVGEKAGTSPKLLAGKDRYSTSAALVKHLWGGPTSRIIYATGASYADAMSGVPAAAAYSAPILLSKSTCRPKEVAEMGGVQSAVLTLGGTGAINETAYYTTCSVLPSVVSQSGGYYRFNMTHRAQQNGYYCGPASAQMILSRLGYSTSRSGYSLSQTNLARYEFLGTDHNRKTSFAESRMAVGMNAWMGSNAYVRLPSPTTAQFTSAITNSFTKTGRPVVVDTQEYAGGAHYNGHPAYSTFSHLMPVEGYNPGSGDLIMLDSASHFYGGSRTSFSYKLSDFTRFLQAYGIYY